MTGGCRRAGHCVQFLISAIVGTAYGTVCVEGAGRKRKETEKKGLQGMSTDEGLSEHGPCILIRILS